MEEAQLPLEGAGARLMRAREAAGVSLAHIASLTRIPERHLVAIEAGDFAALPGKTYAIGFSRTYAKALDLDQDEIGDAVRVELAAQEQIEPRRTIQTFEPGDPARVPSGRLAWLAVAGIVAVLILGFFLARSMFAPGGELPSILTEETPVAVASEAPPAAQPAGGAVVFTALEPKVWVKFSDGAGNQLLQKELAQGESWTIPEGQADVRLWTARPDALSITIGGQAVPKLSDVQTTMKDVPVTAAALLARGTATATTAPDATTTPRNTAAPRQRERRPAAQRPAAPAAEPSVQPSAPAPTVEPAPSPAAT